MAAGLRHQVTRARSTYSSLSFPKVQLAARASQSYFDVFNVNPCGIE